ncbi:MAG: glutaredoxin family protein, partial [Gammaproteobacteria bacterium]|nr:glutaredoxin family protein [Gammaproteobacteria bacterium]NIR19184.1 glutaredoxin family protein [Gammaproteobacteria bacterium]
MTALDVYSRQGCHLCEQLIEELLLLVRGQLDVRIHDIDSRPEWTAAYGTRIPV